MCDMYGCIHIHIHAHMFTCMYTIVHSHMYIVQRSKNGKKEMKIRCMRWINTYKNNAKR